jgi:hypothetical protein
VIPIHHNPCCAKDENSFNRVGFFNRGIIVDSSSPRIEIRVWKVQNQLKQVKTSPKPALAGFVLTSLWFQPQVIPIHHNPCCAKDENSFNRVGFFNRGIIVDSSSPRIEIRVWKVQNQLKQVKTSPKPALAGFVLSSLWFQPQVIPIHHNPCCAKDENSFNRVGFLTEVSS